MIKIKIYTHKKEDQFIEETIENVFDFDLDLSLDHLIIKHLIGEERKVRLIPTKNVKRIVGYEVDG